MLTRVKSNRVHVFVVRRRQLASDSLKATVHFLKKSFRSGNIEFSTEHKLNHITFLVHGAIQVLEGSRSFWHMFTGHLLILNA